MTPIPRQTILVTGSTDELGRAAAIELAARGATVLVHGRDHMRIKAALRDVGGKSRGYCADSHDRLDPAARARLKSLSDRLAGVPG
jgi:NAD(P)-dependent dehydrogenase (short-subunit alcohol dehydrogenase family)